MATAGHSAAIGNIVRPATYRGRMRVVSELVPSTGKFEVVSDYEPAGDQPAAIADLEKRIRRGERDVVLLGATVSWIYGLGTPQEYVDRALRLRVGQQIERDRIARHLVGVQYARNDLAFTRGTFRVRGDTVEIFPVYEELAIRVEMFGDDIE